MIFTDIKLRAGDRMYPVKMAEENGRLFFKFRFNRKLLAEIKNMSGAKWHGFDVPPKKLWSISINRRNTFQLDYLMGGNPYVRYDKDLIDIKTTRSLYDHQIIMVQHCLTRHYAMIAGEMGIGKTLAAIEVMEQSDTENWWWVGPKSAVKSVELELKKWESRVKPRLLTYDKLRSIVKDWEDGTPAPIGIIFDESARIKNYTAQRSQAAQHVADAIWNEHGEEGFVINMTGTPAPKAPTDWWNQCEIICPGFLLEGSFAKFRNRLCLIETREALYGGSYPHLVTWYDDKNKCKKCGQLEKEHDLTDPNYHSFIESINEIAFLGERLKGLVLVQFKKDCLDLPDKQYRKIICEPSASILRVAQTIANTATSTIIALTLLRELSDGFQYTKTKIGTEICALCNGQKEIDVPDPEKYSEGYVDAEFTTIKATCTNCGGSGKQNKYKRDSTYVKCAKDDILIDLLDEHNEIGRIVIYAGFTGSIDKICKICSEQNWEFLRLDGKGWQSNLPINDCLEAMDNSHPKYEYYRKEIPKLAIIGHPASGSEGLTLTSSPSIIYYSNDFNGMYRFQSEDRIHRVGMDTNRGATIIDIFNLPTDEYVFNNLMNKKNLQSLSLGSIKECLK